MAHSINNQIECIEQGISWLNTSTESDKLNKREKLIDIKRQLKRIRYADTVNPAVAIYGASQVGKSYLVDILLTGTVGSLKIQGEGKDYDFIRDINPSGGGEESTSVITRFSICAPWVEKHPNYSVKAILLSPIDIILTLCDSYYNDLTARINISIEQIRGIVLDWKNRYQLRNIQDNPYITEDNIYDIKDLFISGRNFKDIPPEYYKLDEANYFYELSNIIECLDPNEWVNVFSLLWGNNKKFSEIFSKLINGFQQIGFAQEVYIPMRSLLRKHGTLLCVKRIDEFFGCINRDDENNNEIDRTVKVLYNENQTKELEKSVFCVLSAEYVFKLSQNLIGDIQFLNQIDLLDFPGARSRDEVLEQQLFTDGNFTLGKEEINSDKLCSYLLRRGKIAYLFNKYTDQYLISSLIFCFDNEQKNVTTLPRLLNAWIEKMIGKTKEDRERYIKITENIPPLFLVATKYNKDLEKTQNEIEGNYDDVNARWNKRFNTCLDEIVKYSIYSWFTNWTNKFPKFKNIFFLRSFKYSDSSGIFEGYMEKINAEMSIEKKDENGRLIGERKISINYEKHLERLKESFTNHLFVKDYFENPSQTWEDTSTVGNDGSKPIIAKLTKLSNCSALARKNRFDELVRESFNEILNILDPLFRAGNEDALILQAMQQAGEIQFLLDTLFHQNPFFFSKFIATLHICESELHDQILKEITSPDIVNKSGMTLLMMIRLRASITAEDNEQSALSKICETYHFSTVEDANKFLELKGLTIMDIINPSPSKSFSTIIGEMIESYWLNETLKPERFAVFTNDISLLNVFLKRISLLYKEKLRITKILIDTIDPYVTDPSATIDFVEMLADISSEIINRFVNEMGYSYFTSELWNEIVQANEKNNLNLNLDRRQFEAEDIFYEDQIRDAFAAQERVLEINNITEDDIRLLPHCYNHLRWTKLMKIGFIATCDIPTYNVKANNKLREILLKINPDAVKYQ